MKITIPTLAAAVSLAVFACSDDTSDDTSTPAAKDLACKYTGEDFGLGNALFVCGEVPSDSPNIQKNKQDCMDDGGTLADACPIGEKTTCKSTEEGDEDVIIKIYANGAACGDLGFKNADGSESVVPTGGACGPVLQQGISQCIELPESSTFLVKFSACPAIDAPFANECPSNANLVCSTVQDGIKLILHYYEAQLSNHSCSEFGMEDYNSK